MMPTSAFPSLRPEAELLLLCARTHTSPAEADRIADLANGELDADYLLRTASRQGVTQLLYWNLSTICPTALPAEAMAQLKSRFQANARHTMMLSGELLKIMAMFEAEELSAIPYKGPTLAMVTYGNVALRQFQDIDLLIHPADLLRARDLLVAEGYTPQFDLEGERAASFLDVQYQLVLARESDGCIVELHWEISPRYFVFPFDAAQLWQRLETRTLFGRAVPSLAVDDTLLILGAHGAKHNWERLAWICDIAELIWRTEFDWNDLLERAMKLGSERMILLAVWLAHDMLAAPVPTAVIERIRMHVEIEALAAEVREMIFDDAKSDPEVMERSRFHLLTRERWSDRLRYGVRRATLPTMEDWENLPPALARWYPLLRPFRLAVKHGRRLLRRKF